MAPTPRSSTPAPTGRLEQAFILATDDGWDSTHILPKPGSQVLALCGHRPMIVWTRVWTGVYSAHDVPACTRCRSTLQPAEGKTGRPPRAIVVDDNATDRAYVSAIIKGLGNGMEIKETDSARGAIELFEAGPFDLVVSDYHLMGPETGLDVLSNAKRLSPESHRIIVTGDSRQQVREQALKNGVAHAVAIKTEGPRQLREALLTVVRMRPTI